MRVAHDLRKLAVGVVLPVLVASCAYSFPDYDVEVADTTGAGTGGNTGVSASGTTSSMLALDGAPCSVDDECFNGHCIPSNAGDGNVCCTNVCNDMGPASCGTNGKCGADGDSCALYPAGTLCGAESTCEAGRLTSMHCAMGSCEIVSAPCPGGLACEDATTCKTSCTVNADCASPDAACPMGVCRQPAGSACEANDQCFSGLCGTTGTGRCCASTCSPLGAPCGAVDCGVDGECIFPETPCGDTQVCSGFTLTSDYCNGSGQCAALDQSEPCPGHLRCEDANSCLATCGSNDTAGDALCTQGFWCNGSGCDPASLIHGFPCSRGAQCASGICAFFGCFL